jgi:hypothetical protein
MPVADKSPFGHSYKEPYVRVKERDKWDDIYEQTVSELETLNKMGIYNEMSKEQIRTIAFNMAYRVIWLER